MYPVDVRNTSGTSLRRLIQLLAFLAVFAVVGAVVVFVVSVKSTDTNRATAPALVKDITDHDVAVVITEPEFISSSGLGMVMTRSINDPNRKDIVYIYETLAVGDTVEVITARVMNAGIQKVAHKVVNKPAAR